MKKMLTNKSVWRIKQFKNRISNNLLYTVAVILVVLWIVAFLVYGLGSMIHFLLLVAIVAVLFRLIQVDKF